MYENGGLSATDAMLLTNGNRGGFGGYGDGGYSHAMGGNYSNGYSAMGGGNSGNNYSGEGSYAGAGGGYARYSGHSIDDRVLAVLEDMAGRAGSDYERSRIEENINKLRRM